MGKLDGKTAVVTGGANGLGKAAALRLVEDGAAVLLADIDVDTAEKVAKQIVAQGGRAEAIRCDILNEQNIKETVDRAVAVYGSLDIMFNNAAALPQDLMMEDIDILTISTDGWDRMMAGVLRSVMLGCRHAIHQMLKQGGGSIINTSSMYGVSAFNRHPGYGTAKAGVIMLTQYVATAFSPKNIRCNAIAPSMIRTELLERTAPEELIKLNEESALTPKLGKPQDIANIVAFLASDDSAYLTGQVIRADGGTTAHLPTYTDAKRFFDQLD